MLLCASPSEERTGDRPGGRPCTGRLRSRRGGRQSAAGGKQDNDRARGAAGEYRELDGDRSGTAGDGGQTRGPTCLRGELERRGASRADRGTGKSGRLYTAVSRSDEAYGARLAALTLFL